MFGRDQMDGGRDRRPAQHWLAGEDRTHPAEPLLDVGDLASNVDVVASPWPGRFAGGSMNAILGAPARAREGLRSMRRTRSRHRTPPAVIADYSVSTMSIMYSWCESHRTLFYAESADKAAADRIGRPGPGSS